MKREYSQIDQGCHKKCGVVIGWPQNHPTSSGKVPLLRSTSSHKDHRKSGPHHVGRSSMHVILKPNGCATPFLDS